MGQTRRTERTSRTRVTRVRAPRLWAACVLALAGAGTLPLATQAQTADDAVIQAVVDLFGAMRARDGARLRSLFLDGARLTRPTTDDAGQMTIRDTPIDRFVAGILNAREGLLLDERIYDPEVRIDGDLATVWVAYDFYAGEEFSHCGYDAFQLARTRDGWKIFQIADTRRSEGCPER